MHDIAQGKDHQFSMKAQSLKPQDKDRELWWHLNIEYFISLALEDISDLRFILN